MKRTYGIKALLCVLVLGGCGGGAGSPVSPTLSGPAHSNKNLAQAELTITIPAKASTSRKPAYVSPSTQSMTIAVDGGAPQAQNLTPGSTNCTVPAPLAALTCTVPIAATPGSHTFTFVTYDGLNAAGNKLSLNTVAETIVANALNNIPVVLQGVPAEFAVTGITTPNGAFSGSTASGFNVSDNAVVPFSVVALDADGQLIVGPGAPAITVTATSQTPASNFTITSTNGNPNQFAITSAALGASATLTIAAAAAPGTGAPALTTTAPITSAGYVTTVMTTAQLGNPTSLQGITPANGKLDVGQDFSGGQTGIYNIDPANPGSAPTGIQVLSGLGTVGWPAADVVGGIAVAYQGVGPGNFANGNCPGVDYALGGSVSSVLDGGVAANTSGCPQDSPDALAFDASGSLYVGDVGVCTLTKVSVSGGGSSIVAGGYGTCAVQDNAVGTSATFGQITSVAYDSSNGKIYVGDGCEIRVVDPANSYAVTTLAGNPGTCTDADGAGAAGTLSAVNSLTYDAADGDIYAVTSGCALRRVTTAGTVSTVLAPSRCASIFPDGFSPSASIPGASYVTYNPADQHLYVLDSLDLSLRKVFP